MALLFFFLFFTINARTISCSVLITGAFPLINGVNIHELFNTIEIKRPVRHFPIYDFFLFNSEQELTIVKWKKNIIFFCGICQFWYEKENEYYRVWFFFFLNLIKSKNTVFHLGFFCCWKNYRYIFRQSSGHLFQLLSDLLGKRDFKEQFLVKPKLTSE